MTLPDGQLEWLEPARSGSFAMGCIDRRLRRKYHALLTVREPGKGDPWNVLADVRERICEEGLDALLVDPLTGHTEAVLRAFSLSPHPTHHYALQHLRVERRVRMGDTDQVELRYRIRGVHGPLRIVLEPLLRVRPLHALTQQNPFLDGSVAQVDDAFRMLPYAGMPAIAFRLYGAQGQFVEQGAWLSHAWYAWDAEQGEAAQEDLFCPGKLSVHLDSDTEFTFVLGLPTTQLPGPSVDEATLPNFPARLQRGVAQFLMRAKSGRYGVLAGFPWHGARSRDALIALPGMYLATQDLPATLAVLDALADARVHGLIPEESPPSNAEVAGGAADASLLFIRALQWLDAEAGSDCVQPRMPVACELLEALMEGDGRARVDGGPGECMEPGPWALTWMDASRDGKPRAGYTIERDALAYNAVRFVLPWAEAHRPALAARLRGRLRGAETDFMARYWDDGRGYLTDAHDGTHPDAALRPHQLWALGLPYRIVPQALARAALQAVTRALLTPAGLRTLDPQAQGYRGQAGPQKHGRAHAAHQGSVWPWLVGIYADAVHHTLGRAALEQHLSPVLSFMVRHLDQEGCIGHISEQFDGDPPHAAGAAPAHAASMAEVYRVLCMLHSPS